MACTMNNKRISIQILGNTLFFQNFGSGELSFQILGGDDDDV